MAARAPRWLPPLLLTFAFAHAQDLQPVPALAARVTDLTGTLTADQRARIERKLATFEERKGAQLAVLIVPTTKPEEIEQYSIRVVERWKLGRAKADDGALLLVARNDRRLRIEVGHGLEGVLTDAKSRRIIEEIVAPRFRNGDYAGGISAGLNQMIRAIDGEPLPAPDRRRRRSSQRADEPVDGTPGVRIVIALFIGLMAGNFLLRRLGRVLPALAAGGLAGCMIWFLGNSVLEAAVGTVAGVLLMFFGRVGRSKSGGSGRGDRSGGSGGSRSGGFRGGGGSFGGGGASGRW
jgi:uncharacterized protein